MKKQTFIFGTPETRERAFDFLTGLSMDKSWEVTIAPYRKRRSLSQNAMYWKWLGIIANDTGHTSDEIHEFCKMKFLPPVFIELGGESQEARTTTTKLRTAEMSEYMDKVYAWSTSELGIILPIPEEQLNQ